MSWVSSVHYYRGINTEVSGRLGGDHCAEMVTWQTDFADIVACQRAGNWAAAGRTLAYGALRLRGAGAEVVAICANTMHLVADQVAAAAAPAELVDLVAAATEALVECSITTVGLLGTAYTMESATLFPPRLRTAGIEMIVPDALARGEIQRATFGDLTRGTVSDETRATFHAAIEGLVERGAEAILLACTEHALAVDAESWSLPVLDTTQIHIDAIVDAALAPADGVSDGSIGQS